MSRDDGPFARWPLWIPGSACLVVTVAGFALFLWLAVPGVGAVVPLAGRLAFGLPTTLLAVIGLVSVTFAFGYARLFSSTVLKRIDRLETALVQRQAR